ncbi:MAG TPA: DUF6263 family protein [Gemmatimonadaceae bacterium]|nr:DUF6263 family protein [Gemmatimonadaceae bacterium]
MAVAFGSAPLRAQARGAVTLRINPRVGDTLYTRFDQQVDMTGSTRLGNTDTTVVMHTSMLLLSRVLVQEADNGGTTVLTITDSVALASRGGRDEDMPSPAAQLAMQGQRLRLRITPEGSATILDTPDALAPDLQAVISQMPATLPDTPVRVGGSWSQVMAIPIPGELTEKDAATLHTTYHLDSLSRDGSIAYISMRGTLSRDSSAAPLPHGVKLTSTGSITGNLRMDRQRGWWTRSTAIIGVRSTLTPPAGRHAQPVHFEMTITQHMRATDHP